MFPGRPCPRHQSSCYISMDSTPRKRLRSDGDVDYMVAMESSTTILIIATALMFLHVDFEISNVKPHAVVDTTCTYHDAHR
jgi:hypothetical protein